MLPDLSSWEGYHELSVPNLLIKNPFSVLAGVAQWIEHWPVNQRVASSIPSQGTYLGFGPAPPQGAHKRQPHIDVSLPLFLS